MPQARLPDINTAFIKHRNEAMSSLKSANYDSVFGSLYALNALLPDTLDDSNQMPKYRVVISDIEYNKLTKPAIYVHCYHCDDKHIYESITMYKYLLSKDDQLISRQQYQQVWNCPKCKNVNSLYTTKMTETQLKEPYFLGVVPKPPLHHFGLVSRTQYHNKMRQWALTFLTELEGKMAQFRDDNWTKEDQSKTFEQFENIDSGEEA